MFSFKTLAWQGDAATGTLSLLDQTRLPGEVTYLDCSDTQQVWHAIKRLSVRGAPAIGVAAAYGCVLGARTAGSNAPTSISKALHETAAYLNTSRPTAVNLFWATARMCNVQPCTLDTLLAEAKRIHEQDITMCRRIGEHAAHLVRKLTDDSRRSAMTHCNAGALATTGIGTATAPFYVAFEQGHRFNVFVDETRPLLQGARLTAYELQSAGVQATLICDSMAGQVMREGRVGIVITGADRIAANGDAANKIGTYGLAVLAKHHGVPFYVAAPSSTFDLDTPDGSRVPIEQRAAEEITQGFGPRTAPLNIATYSPAFDVTPHDLITAIITERGLIEPINTANVAKMIER